MRLGDTGSAKAHGPDAANGVPQIVGLDLEGQIAPVESMVYEQFFHHVLGGVAGDGLSEQGTNFLKR